MIARNVTLRSPYFAAGSDGGGFVFAAVSIDPGVFGVGTRQDQESGMFVSTAL